MDDFLATHETGVPAEGEVAAPHGIAYRSTADIARSGTSADAAAAAKTIEQVGHAMVSPSASAWFCSTAYQAVAVRYAVQQTQHYVMGNPLPSAKVLSAGRLLYTKHSIMQGFICCCCRPSGWRRRMRRLRRRSGGRRTTSAMRSRRTSAGTWSRCCRCAATWTTTRRRSPSRSQTAGRASRLEMLCCQLDVEDR